MLTFNWLNRFQNQFHLGIGRAARRSKSRHERLSVPWASAKSR